MSFSEPGSLSLPGRPAPIPFTLDLSFVDFLRPATLDTPAFGAAWTQPAMSAEAVISVPAGPSCRTPADFLARLAGPGGLAMHPVQAIAASE